MHRFSKRKATTAVAAAAVAAPAAAQLRPEEGEEDQHKKGGGEKKEEGRRSAPAPPASRLKGRPGWGEEEPSSRQEDEHEEERGGPAPAGAGASSRDRQESPASSKKQQDSLPPPHLAWSKNKRSRDLLSRDEVAAKETPAPDERRRAGKERRLLESTTSDEVQRGVRGKDILDAADAVEENLDGEEGGDDGADDGHDAGVAGEKPQRGVVEEEEDDEEEEDAYNAIEPNKQGREEEEALLDEVSDALSAHQEELVAMLRDGVAGVQQKLDDAKRAVDIFAESMEHDLKVFMQRKENEIQATVRQVHAMRRKLGASFRIKIVVHR